MSPLILLKTNLSKFFSSGLWPPEVALEHVRAPDLEISAQVGLLVQNLHLRLGRLNKDVVGAWKRSSHRTIVAEIVFTVYNPSFYYLH